MYAPARSMNNEFSEGSTDNKYKKIVQDRGGRVDPATYENRADLNDHYFGLHEKQVKVTPDGLLHATPNYVPNPAVVTVDAI